MVVGHGLIVIALTPAFVSKDLEQRSILLI
jgi:hypothetical protein